MMGGRGGALGERPSPPLSQGQPLPRTDIRAATGTRCRRLVQVARPDPRSRGVYLYCNEIHQNATHVTR